MSKLHFKYWSMWAGKTLELIKIAYNYKERGQKVLVFNSSLDTRFKNWEISSRTWASIPCFLFDKNTDIFSKITEELEKTSINCILIDEAQFLTNKQVESLAVATIRFKIPVICLWIKTDFLGNLFEWSKRLLELATNIEEIKTVCWCWNKATMNARIKNGKVIKTWEQIEIWANEKYISLCLKHYIEEYLG